ncbi:MAG: Xaa-Pro peptidase family protein [Gammaproteobacteria bacterium]|nr:Xaa-Pro peptidase family protein [Gammaproteobacteria bacterium]
MALHFSAKEFVTRRRSAVQAMVERGLDGMLHFRQESMYYLTGYDTFGFCFFQCLYLGADSRVTLLTRAPDLRQAEHTSDIEDIRIWVDGPDRHPVDDLQDILQQHGCRGHRLGVEYDAHGLTAYNGKRLDAALEGFATLVDASDLVGRLRMIKSAAELQYVNRAAELADRALERATELTRPGAFEGDILAAMHTEIFSGDGDYPGNEFIIGSGPDALLVRYSSGRRTLSERDQLTLEFAGVFRHYHCALMRTFIIGEPETDQLSMYDAVRDGMAAGLEALKPGAPLGDVFDAYRQVVDPRGYGPHRFNACGYSLGATFTPSWMDWPMLYHGNPTIAEPNMVLFPHMVLMNSETKRAMALGQTVLVTQDGVKRLSRVPLDLVVR